MSEESARPVALLGRTCLAAPYTVAGVVLLIALGIPFCLRSSSHSDWDQVYLRASRHMQAGMDCYQFQDGYLYPPLAAWLATPFTWLPTLPARIAWYLVNCCAIVVLLRGIWRLSGGSEPKAEQVMSRREHWIIALGMLSGVYYLLDALSNQQTDLVIAALMVGGCLALNRQWSFSAATLFGIAAGLKCTPLLWGPYLMWRRKPLAGLWVAIIAVSLNLAPNLTATPPDGNWWLTVWVQRYLAPLANRDHAPGQWGTLINYNHSISGVCNRWLIADWTWDREGFHVIERSERVSTPQLKGIVLAVEGLLVLTAWLIMRHTVKEQGARRPLSPLGRWGCCLEYGIVLLLMLLLSPQSSKAHFCTLLLPGFCLARLAVERRDLVIRLLLAAAITAGILSNKDVWGSHIYTLAIWYGSVFWNTIALLAGSLYALWRMRREAIATQIIMQDDRIAA